eukprot:g38490.t1
MDRKQNRSEVSCCTLDAKTRPDGTSEVSLKFKLSGSTPVSVLSEQLRAPTMESLRLQLCEGGSAIKTAIATVREQLVHCQAGCPFNLQVDSILGEGLRIEENSLLQFHRMMACRCDRPARWKLEDEPIFLRTAVFDEFCDALKATDSLRSIICLTSHGFPCPLAEELYAKLEFAMQQNKSLLHLLLYYDGSDASDMSAYASKPVNPGPWGCAKSMQRLQALLQRNAQLNALNASLAQPGTGSSDPSTCPFDLAKSLFLGKISLLQSELEKKGDCYFCQLCVKTRGDKKSCKRGTLQCVMSYRHNVFKDWHVSFHGTTLEACQQVIEGGLTLLKPGDVKLGGSTISVRGGHIPRPFQRRHRHTGRMETFNPNQIFTSPSVIYAGHPAYAKPFLTFHPKNGLQLSMQFAFQCRQRPQSYKIGQVLLILSYLVLSYLILSYLIVPADVADSHVAESFVKSSLKERLGLGNDDLQKGLWAASLRERLGHHFLRLMRYEPHVPLDLDILRGG